MIDDASSQDIRLSTRIRLALFTVFVGHSLSPVLKFVRLQQNAVTLNSVQGPTLHQ